MECGMSRCRYFHSKPLANWNHYRLKLFYVGGEESYSKVAFVLVKSVAEPLVKALPNPVDERMTVEVNGDIDSHTQVLVSGVSGRVLNVLSITGEQNSVDMKG